MSWKLKNKLKQLVKEEEGTIVKDFGGRLSIALVYPNTYFVGMSNLGVHNIYRLFNERNDVVCERAFLPEKADLNEHRRTLTPILTVESQRPITDFDMIAFSTAFENDLSNIDIIFELSGIKKGAGPRLIAGGAAVTLIPELFEDRFDEIYGGDFEKNPPQPPFTKGGCGGIMPAHNVIWTENTEFGSMHLVEIQRGCPHRCKFCAAPVIYHPFKQFSKEEVIGAIELGLPHRKKIGLIGGDVLGHKNFVEIAEYIHSRGGTFSPSSVRADRITPEVAGLLKKSGHKTITLAPETGSEGLRKEIGKNISNNSFLKAADILAGSGIRQIKLYFMIGLPGENQNDISAIADLVREMHKLMPKGGKISVAINPFIPKAKTYYENEEFGGVVQLKGKITFLKRELSKLGGITARFESPLLSLREYEFQKGKH